MKTWKAISLASVLALGSFLVGTTFSPEIKEAWVNKTASERKKEVYLENKTHLVYANPQNLAQAITNYVAEKGKKEKGLFVFPHLGIRGPTDHYSIEFTKDKAKYRVDIRRLSFKTNLSEQALERFNRLVPLEQFRVIYRAEDESKPGSLYEEFVDNNIDMEDVRKQEHSTIAYKSDKKSYVQVLEDIADHFNIKKTPDPKTGEMTWTWPDKVWK